VVSESGMEYYFELPLPAEGLIEGKKIVEAGESFRIQSG
jgi:hypothetical protein